MKPMRKKKLKDVVKEHSPPLSSEQVKDIVANKNPAKYSPPLTSVDVAEILAAVPKKRVRVKKKQAKPKKTASLKRKLLRR